MYKLSINMERIVIEVADETAKKWRLSSQKQRTEIFQLINNTLAEELVTNPNEEFKQFLDELSDTMKARGLTEEILDDILKEDRLS